MASPSLVAIHVLVAIHPCHLRLASRRLRHCGPRPCECGRGHRSVLKVKLVGFTCEEEILFLVGSPFLEVNLGEVGSLSLGESPSCIKS